MSNLVGTVENTMEDHLGRMRLVIGGLLDDEARVVANAQQGFGSAVEFIVIGPVRDPVSCPGDEAVGAFVELPFDAYRAFEEFNVIVLDRSALWPVDRMFNDVRGGCLGFPGPRDALGPLCVMQ